MEAWAVWPLVSWTPWPLCKFPVSVMVSGTILEFLIKKLITVDNSSLPMIGCATEIPGKFSAQNIGYQFILREELFPIISMGSCAIAGSTRWKLSVSLTILLLSATNVER